LPPKSMARSMKRDISQGSVATHFFSDIIITNFLLILTMNYFLKIG